MTRARTLIASAALVLLSAGAVVGGLLAHGGAREPPASLSLAERPIHHPNIVVVTTDDQTVSQFSHASMPFTWEFFKRRGSLFTNSLSDPPLCCPDRAGFLTGEYAQNHGVETNDAGYFQLRSPGNIFPAWLGHAGYRTGLVGKYLNGYPVLTDSPAPGWDYFYAAGGDVEYRHFDVGDNGTPRHFGSGHYSTDNYTRVAKRFIGDSVRRGSPFFVWLTYNAPHTVPDSDPPCGQERAQPKSGRDWRRFRHTPLPRNPAVGESDLSDKGRAVRDRKPFVGRHRHHTVKAYRCALATMPPVNRGIRRIVAKLRSDHQLSRTIVVFTSDNGYFYGEHGIPDDKELPYDPALRVPLAIAIPPRLRSTAQPGEIGSLVSNVDLAPTLLDYAHAQPCTGHGCRRLDGHSLRPLLEGREPGWTHGRTLPVELNETYVYKAIRSSGLMFMRLTADRMGQLPHPDTELYDLRADPYELHNLWRKGLPQRRRQRLLQRLRRVTRCAGTSGPRACP